MRTIAATAATAAALLLSMPRPALASPAPPPAPLATVDRPDESPGMPRLLADAPTAGEPAGQPALLVTAAPGDTVSELAQRYGGSVAAIAAASNLQSPDLVLAGQQLAIPGGVMPPSPPPPPEPAAGPMPAGHPATAPFAVGPNHFAFGYCTWYVASRRPVPWYGNAWEWWANARAMGYAEGQQPRPGAIMVTGEGPIGHVAYVESAAPDGSWTVSEMNYRAWDVVDTRTIRPGTVPLVGFIY